MTSRAPYLVGGALGLGVIVWLVAGSPGIPPADAPYLCGDYVATVSDGTVTEISSEDADVPEVTSWSGVGKVGDYRLEVTFEFADGSQEILACERL